MVDTSCKNVFLLSSYNISSTQNTGNWKDISNHLLPDIQKQQNHSPIIPSTYFHYHDKIHTDRPLLFFCVQFSATWCCTHFFGSKTPAYMYITMFIYVPRWCISRHQHCRMEFVHSWTKTIINNSFARCSDSLINLVSQLAGATLSMIIWFLIISCGIAENLFIDTYRNGWIS